MIHIAGSLNIADISSRLKRTRSISRPREMAMLISAIEMRSIAERTWDRLRTLNSADSFLLAKTLTLSAPPNSKSSNIKEKTLLKKKEKRTAKSSSVSNGKNGFRENEDGGNEKKNPTNREKNERSQVLHGTENLKNESIYRGEKRVSTRKTIARPKATNEKKRTGFRSP